MPIVQHKLHILFIKKHAHILLFCVYIVSIWKEGTESLSLIIFYLLVSASVM